MGVPSWSAGIRQALVQKGLSMLVQWFTPDFETFINSKFSTDGDITLNTKQTGIVMTNAAGTVTKRVRLNSAGDGLIFEDV